ncbi:MAG: hypothetical protein IT338_06075 [Thermomicrobiales bacterium]|nr:hypothetical protein [Thermomicrobiales bacterium]
MTAIQHLRAAGVAALLLVTLAACGPMPEPAPPTAPPTVAPPVSSTPPPGTAAPTTPTLGELSARVGIAWAGVTSYELTFTGSGMIVPPLAATPVGASAAGTPVASPVATPGATPVARQGSAVTTVRQVILPDRQRQVVSGHGDQDYEAIAAGGRIFVRGPLARQIAPGADAESWIAIDPSRLAADSTLSLLLGGLPAIPPAPLAQIPERLASQELRDLGTIDFDGRTCRVYGAVDTAATTGMRVDRSIAIDAQDIPCFIETSTGGSVQAREEFRAIDAAPAIEAPSRATPVAVPPALATPVVRD